MVPPFLKDLVPLLVVILPIAACGTGLAPAVSERPARRLEPEEPVELHLEPYAGRLRQIPVELGDRAYAFLFDTGGGLTLIDPDLASAAGCEPHGRLVGFRMSGERVEFRQCGEASIRLGSLELDPYLAVFDLMALLPEELPPLWGVVSLHTLQDRPFTLDLAENRATVETRASLAERVRDMSELRLHVERDIEGRGVAAYLEARAERGSLRLLIDSGNLAGFILAPHALDQLGVERTPDGSILELEIELVGLGPMKTVIVVQDVRHDGVIGAEFLERLILTMELRSGRAWGRWKS